MVISSLGRTRDDDGDDDVSSVRNRWVIVGGSMAQAQQNFYPPGRQSVSCQ